MRQKFLEALASGKVVPRERRTDPERSGEQDRSKKRERMLKNLIRLGVNPVDAYRWSRSRLGGWAIAQSPILNTTITIRVLSQRGYESMFVWYQKVVPHKFNPTLFPIVY